MSMQLFELQLFEHQFAWWFDPSVEPDFNALPGEVKQALGTHTFINPWTTLPLPKEAPAEIPRVQMETTDRRVRISIARSRLDFFSAYPQPEDQANVESFFSLVSSITAALNRQTASPMKFSRLGCVTRYFQENDAPEKLIAAKLLKKARPHLKEISVRILETTSYEGLAYNDSYQFDVGVHNTSGKKALVCTRDINTDEARSVADEPDTCEKFVDFCKEKLRIESINNFLGEQ